MLHGHGDDGYRYPVKPVADFSTNVWYGGEPTGLKEYLFDQWANINRYPEVLAESLAGQIAGHHRVGLEQVLVNSGTTESIYLIAQAFAGQKTTIVTPAFAEYEDACRLHHHQLDFLDWADLVDLPPVTSDLVFICNPNNPTGTVFEPLAAWLTQHPRTLFVVDEAFIDFTDRQINSIPLLRQYDNLISMRSLTKAYAIPGLRLGYVVSSGRLINRLKSVKQPWTVNAMAIAAGRFIFEHFPQSQPPLAQLLSDKRDFVEQLRQHDAIRVCDGHTHFFLAELRTGSAAALKTFLLEKHGLLIRDAGNFRGLGKGHFRVCTLTPEKNRRLIGALATWQP